MGLLLPPNTALGKGKAEDIYLVLRILCLKSCSPIPLRSKLIPGGQQGNDKQQF